MKIRTKVIISIFNEGKVLLSKGFDPVRNFTFYIPLGGGVEFGEKLVDAAKREIKEEIGLEDVNLVFNKFIENFFEFMGKSEHEIMYHYMCDIDCEKRDMLPKEGVETDGNIIEICWFSKSDLEKNKNNIIPPDIYNEIIKKL